MRRIYSIIILCVVFGAPYVDAATDTNALVVGEVSVDQYWLKLDEYSNISPNQEKVRLNNLIIVLRENKYSTGYIVAYGGRRSCVGEAQARAARAREYLIRSGDIEAKRVVTIDAGHRDKWTIEIQWAAAGVPPLTKEMVGYAGASLPAAQVRIIGKCKLRQL